MAESVTTPKIFTKDEPEKKLSSSYEDGGEILFCCSNCDEKLVVLWITRPNEKLDKKPLKWKMRAKCCYCGDYSFVKEVVGGFHYKGYDLPHPNGNPEDVIPLVNVIDFRREKDVLTFITEKKNEKN
jgi:hypothetical protein